MCASGRKEAPITTVLPPPAWMRCGTCVKWSKETAKGGQRRGKKVREQKEKDKLVVLDTHHFSSKRH